MHPHVVHVAAVGLIGVVAVACSSTGSTSINGSSSPAGTPATELAPIHGTYSPSIDPSNFVAEVTNPYWPLLPGTAYRFQGVRGATPQTDDEVVTLRTKQILGISCTVVRDTVSEHGRAVERTFDYYAQDAHGNVWYMGETRSS
jgi:hypothetical protein